MAEGIFTQEALRVYFIADSVSIPFLFVSGRLAGWSGNLKVDTNPIIVDIIYI